TGLLSATLDASDIRSVHRGHGLRDEHLREVRRAVSPALIEAYQKRSLLGPDTVTFLWRAVPVATAEYFLNLFGPDDAYSRYVLADKAEVAVSLNADPEDAEYVEFVAAIVRNKMTGSLYKGELDKLDKDYFKERYPELDWEKPQYT